MAKSEKITKYRVLCVAVALGCSLFGILLGISLNLNSKDVIRSYRISMTTIAQNNKMLSEIKDAEWNQLCDLALEKGDTMLFRKVEKLSAQSEIYHYLDSLRAALILYVEGKPVDQLRRPDAVSEPTFFMLNQGNAKELRVRLQQYQDFLNSCIGKGQAPIDFNLQAPDDNLPVSSSYSNSMSWENYHFYYAMEVETVCQMDMIKQQLMMADLKVFRSLINTYENPDVVNN